MPTDNEAMQILAFGDVYMPDPEAAEETHQPLSQTLPKTPTVSEEPVFEHNSPAASYTSQTDTSSIPSSPPTTYPASLRTSNSFENPTEPCSSFHHRPHQPTIPERSSGFRSLFNPSSFKGKLTQMLVSCTLLGAFLTTYLALVFTDNLTPTTQIVSILLILTSGVLATHAVISIFLFRFQRHASLLPTMQSMCDEKNCSYCRQHEDVLPRDDSLYAPRGAIRVHLTRDEQLKAKKLRHASDFSNANSSQLSLTSPPPAYGAWRCSVRADPSLLHWHRVDVSQQAGDQAAVQEAEVMEEVPLSPTLAQAWREDAAGGRRISEASQGSAVRVSMGKATPAVVMVRTSGNWSESGNAAAAGTSD